MPPDLIPGDTPGGKDPNRKALLIALAVSVALHAGAILGFGRIAHGGQPAPMDVMNVQLVTDPASESDPNAPFKQFTELPPDRADATPNKAELLSNVTLSFTVQKFPKKHEELTPETGSNYLFFVKGPKTQMRAIKLLPASDAVIKSVSELLPVK